MQQNGEISLYADKIYYFSAKKEGKIRSKTCIVVI